MMCIVSDPDQISTTQWPSFASRATSQPSARPRLLSSAGPGALTRSDTGEDRGGKMTLLVGTGLRRDKQSRGGTS